MTYGSLLRGQNGYPSRHIEVDEEALRQVLLIRANLIQVDETWYVRTYPDVAEALRRGEIASGREHYIRDGFFEDRFPRPIIVDEDWYMQEYPDVADAIRRGRFVSPQAHFDEFGFKEGRLPSLNWAL